MSAEPHILIYAFEPFGPYRRNITADLIAQLPLRPQWQAHVLPVRFEAELFLKPVRAFEPDLILGLGQYPRGNLIRIERKAFNHKRDRTQNLDESIDPEGSDSLALRWQIRPNSEQRVSYDAGRYVCNFSMYTLAQYAQEQGIASAFLHLPCGFSLTRARRSILQILNKAGRK